MKYVLFFSLLSLGLILSCKKQDSDRPSNKDDNSLITISYIESDAIIGNPERGFYRHHSFTSASSGVLSPTILKHQRNLGTSLLLTIYYLNDFRDQLISQEYLTMVENNMKALREGGSKCVLRFAYSSSTSDEPYDASQELVLQHIDQLRPILDDYSDVIYVMEAGFVGVWGEWYYTSHFNMNPSSSVEYAPRKNVLMALLSALPEDRMVCVRTPSFKLNIFDISYSDTLTLEKAYDGSDLSRVASHNDCFLASANDYGTFFSNSERGFWEAESKYTIMGGETCAVSDFSNCNNAIAQLEKYHWSYLNSGYHGDVLQSWDNDGCMDEVAKRLGYRFVLKEGQFTENPVAGENFKAVLTVKNVGFAAPSNPRKVELIFVGNANPEDKYVVPVDSDPRFWFAGGEFEINVEYLLPKEMVKNEYSVYLNLPAPESTLYANAHFSIQLANEDVWESETGYNKVHTIQIQ